MYVTNDPLDSMSRTSLQHIYLQSLNLPFSKLQTIPHLKLTTLHSRSNLLILLYGAPYLIFWYCMLYVHKSASPTTHQLEKPFNTTIALRERRTVFKSILQITLHFILELTLSHLSNHSQRE